MLHSWGLGGRGLIEEARPLYTTILSTTAPRSPARSKTGQSKRLTTPTTYLLRDIVYNTLLFVQVRRLSDEEKDPPHKQKPL